MKRKTVLASTAAAAVLLAAGGTSAVALADDGEQQRASSVRAADRDGRDHDDDRDDDAGERGENRREAKAAKLSAEEAVAAALKAVPGQVTELELDDEDGRLVWEADVLGKDGSWHDVTLDPADGKVLGKHDGGGRGTDRARETLKSVQVDAAGAAHKAAGEGTVTSLDLEDEDGKVHWEADTTDRGGAEHEYTVDARTGDLARQTDDD